MTGKPVRWGRREVLAAAAGVVAPPALAAAEDPLSGARLYADVRAYADAGDHRTGTPGDDRVSAWLVRELGRAGYEATSQPFDFPVFNLRRAEVGLAGRSIAAFPLWTPVATGAEGLVARLSTTPAADAILVISLPYNPNSSLELPAYAEPLKAAARSGARAVIAITESPVDELVALNAEANAAPWGAPVLLVAGREKSTLLAAAGRGEHATFRLDGTTTRRRATNVIARRVRPGPAVVISTPKSGWMRCAGERGSGIAIWLGLARWLAQATDHNLVVIATSGHEFHGYGGHFAAKLTPAPADTRLWIHLGANIAAYDFGLEDGRLVRRPGPSAARYVACTHDLVSRATAAFAGQPGYRSPIDIDVQRAPGEVALYHRLGYRPILGLVAGHPLHHTPRDLADVTGPDILEPVARGLQAVLTGL